MKSVIIAIAVLGLGAAPVLAQQQAGENAGNRVPTASADTAAKGEVRRIDKEAGKITIRHGEIKNLDMPPMTMVFQVADRALLDNVLAGDAVQFTAEKQGGALVVTEISKAK